MLEVKNLSININKTVVDDISFEINSGEVLALIGESGSGKSMTALSIMRLLPNNAIYSNASKISLYNTDMLTLSEKQMRAIRGRDICMIFQDPMTCLNPVLTVGSQLSEVLSLHANLHGRENYIEALSLLDVVRIDNPVHRYKCYPHELSGGMKQRIMIAMALAGKPSLLIADEPTTALDVTTQAQILSLMRELQKEKNMSILFITHDLAVAAQIADKIAVMKTGKIIEQNSCTQFFAHPQHSYSQKLLDSSPSTFKIKAQQPTANPTTILSIKDLRVYFPVKSGLLRKTIGYIKAVDGVDLELYSGETLALVGESGCGKTTLGKAILSLIEPVEGEVLFDNENLLNLTQHQWRSKRADLQIIFQDPFAALNSKRMIVDSLEEGLLVQNKYPRREDRLAKIDELLINVGLKPEYKWHYPHEFSGGERQRLCIARAIAVEPKIIICDEPTSSLDVSIQAQVISLIKKLQLEHNLSYLFISHDIAVVSSLAQRIAVMYRGKIVESGVTAAVLNNPQHDYTKKLLAAVPKLNLSAC